MRSRASTRRDTKFDFAADSSPEARVGQRIEPQPNGCWLYDGEPDEYGRVYLGHGVRKVAHVFVYETLVGPVPRGHHLHHECETPGCCNPEHLTPLLPNQHKAEHELRRMESTTGSWKRDPLAVLKYVEALDRRG